jgi:transposase
MARYIPDHSSQTLFINGSLDSLLPDNSVARSIRHGLGELDFSRFDAVYRNDLEGRPAIDPRRLTGLWILALLRGVTSSVQVARLCRTDIEFRWLCGDAHVQKSTLSAFRGDHSEALRDLSTQLLTVTQ